MGRKELVLINLAPAASSPCLLTGLLALVLPSRCAPSLQVELVLHFVLVVRRGGGASGPACGRRVKSERKTRKSGYSTSQDRKTLLCIFLSSALPCVLSSPLLGVSARRFLFLRARSQQVLLRGHEQVSRESRREKGRGVGRKQQTRATAGDGAPRAEATRRVKSIGGLLTKIWVSGLRFLLSAGPSPSILLSRLWLR